MGYLQEAPGLQFHLVFHRNPFDPGKMSFSAVQCTEHHLTLIDTFTWRQKKNQHVIVCVISLTMCPGSPGSPLSPLSPGGPWIDTDTN